MRPASGEDGWFSLVRGDLCGGCHTCWRGGVDEKAGIESLCLSPYVEEPLNSKVIKGFVPEQRSYVFFEFRDSYVLSLWTFDVRYTQGRIWLWYIKTAVFHFFLAVAMIGSLSSFSSLMKLFCSFTVSINTDEPFSF